eukprot:7439-Pyramimonas_sp.AAC.1
MKESQNQNPQDLRIDGAFRTEVSQHAGRADTTTCARSRARAALLHPQRCVKPSGSQQQCLLQRNATWPRESHNCLHLVCSSTRVLELYDPSFDRSTWFTDSIKAHGNVRIK